MYRKSCSQDKIQEIKDGGIVVIEDHEDGVLPLHYWNVLLKIYALLIYITAYYRILCLLRQLQLWELNHLVGTP
jgi:hypothetical protein